MRDDWALESADTKVLIKDAPVSVIQGAIEGLHREWANARYADQALLRLEIELIIRRLGLR